MFRQLRRSSSFVIAGNSFKIPQIDWPEIVGALHFPVPLAGA